MSSGGSLFTASEGLRDPASTTIVPVSKEDTRVFTAILRQSISFACLPNIENAKGGYEIVLRLRWYRTIEDRLSCLALALNQDQNLILAASTPGGPEGPRALFNEAAMGTNWSSVTCSA